ncbi:unnamed protein product [Dicrocoelium dendriticum]|nr:unnamed protein product [Dicrocoelium dendriticum]CAI2737335.1 unnamed protein product [Dicrocoelium dendriticum]CAI2737336.1 unnamed protein product [Dicrocoelium dendriticum]
MSTVPVFTGAWDTRLHLTVLILLVTHPIALCAARGNHISPHYGGVQTNEISELEKPVGSDSHIQPTISKTLHGDFPVVKHLKVEASDSPALNIAAFNNGSNGASSVLSAPQLPFEEELISSRNQLQGNKRTDSEIIAQQHISTLTWRVLFTTLCSCMVLAHANAISKIRPGIIHFDDDEPWVYEYNITGINFGEVALHEVGHALGLLHSPTLGAVMYPFYGFQEKENTLHSDDVQRIQSIYGVRDARTHAARAMNRPENCPNKFKPPKTPEIIVRGYKRNASVEYCKTGMNSITISRDNIFYITKGSKVWITECEQSFNSGTCNPQRRGPLSIQQAWSSLPAYVDHIDAGVERSDKAIYLFSGSRFWLLNAYGSLKYGVPPAGLPLSYLGLPETLRRIDTAFTWGRDGRIYLFSDRRYWKLEEWMGPFGCVSLPTSGNNTGEMWRSLPYPIGPALTLPDGKTIFFHGVYYLVFDNQRMEAKSEWVQINSLPFLGCP